MPFIYIYISKFLYLKITASDSSYSSIGWYRNKKTHTHTQVHLFSIHLQCEAFLRVSLVLPLLWFSPSPWKKISLFFRCCVVLFTCKSRKITRSNPNHCHLIAIRYSIQFRLTRLSSTPKFLHFPSIHTTITSSFHCNRFDYYTHTHTHTHFD